MGVLLEGPVHSWTLCKHKHRNFISVVIPYRDYRQASKVEQYSARKGSGQQRPVTPSHSARLRRAMQDGSYTPVNNYGVGLTRDQRKLVRYEERGGVPWAVIDIDQTGPLPSINGFHRADSLKDLSENGVEEVHDQPIGVTVYLDGDPQEDFLNFQKGKAVDKVQLLSMSVQRKLLPLKDIAAHELALAVAWKLQADARGDFKGQIKFDPHGTFPIPITTLCAKGPSDQGTSLLGLAKVGLARGDNQADWLAEVVTDTCFYLKNHATSLLDLGKVLTPPPDGTKGSYTMLIGVSTLMAFRLHFLGRESPGHQDLDRLANAAKLSLDEEVDKKFPAQMKRSLIGSFAREFLADLKTDFHDDVPVSLLKLLAPSAYACSPLPKEPKARKGQKAVTQDGPQVVSNTD